MLISKNAYLVTLALVSPTLNRRSRAKTPIFTIKNQHFLVQMAQAQSGPAQPKAGPGQIWEIWRPGSPEIWGPKSKKTKFSKSESVLPEMSARSRLVEKKSSWPHLGHPRPFSPWTGKMHKMCLFSLVGQWFTRFGGGGEMLASQNRKEPEDCRTMFGMFLVDVQWVHRVWRLRPLGGF